MAGHPPYKSDACSRMQLNPLIWSKQYFLYSICVTKTPAASTHIVTTDVQCDVSLLLKWIIFTVGMLSFRQEAWNHHFYSVSFIHHPPSAMEEILRKLQKDASGSKHKAMRDACGVARGKTHLRVCERWIKCTFRTDGRAWTLIKNNVLEQSEQKCARLSRMFIYCNLILITAVTGCLYKLHIIFLEQHEECNENMRI